MKCLILAAGYATRLYPLTENFPKPLLKVGEKSILDWLVDDLVDTTDIDEFVVISNHKFAQHFVNWKNEKVKTRPYEITVIDDGTSTNETRLGAVKDIQMAVEKLNLVDDLLVMAGDKGSVSWGFDHVFVSAYRTLVLPSLRRQCDAVYFCTCHGLSGRRLNGVCGNGRHFGSFPCRIGLEPSDSSCISLDESVGICRKCTVYSLLPDWCRNDY